MANYGRGRNDGYGTQSPESIDEHQERDAIEGEQARANADWHGRRREAGKRRPRVSADVLGHLQPFSDLPAVGSRVKVHVFRAQTASNMELEGEVFAHIKHPDPKHSGWGFALIKFN